MTEEPKRTMAVFAVADRSYTVDDVIASAHFRGEVEAWWSRVLLLDECETLATDLGEADEGELQAVSEQFRYERDLITAEETENWLGSRGLTQDDFSDYFVRHYWKERLEEKAEPRAIDYLTAPAALLDMLPTELLLSGGLEEMAVALSWRCAAAREGGASKVTREGIDVERALFLERIGAEPDACPEWLARAGYDERWLEEMLVLEAGYRLEAGAVLTVAECQRMLHVSRMRLTRVELEILEVESLAAAREAAWCVREDGTSMEELAKDAGYPFRRDEVVAENLAPELQQKVLCTVPGELLEPIAQGDGFHLWRPTGKIEPTLDDPRIRARIEHEILDGHFSELAARHVRWQPGFLPP